MKTITILVLILISLSTSAEKKEKKEKKMKKMEVATIYSEWKPVNQEWIAIDSTTDFKQGDRIVSDMDSTQIIGDSVKYVYLNAFRVVPSNAYLIESNDSIRININLIEQRRTTFMREDVTKLKLINTNISKSKKIK